MILRVVLVLVVVACFICAIVSTAEGADLFSRLTIGVGRESYEHQQLPVTVASVAPIFRVGDVNLRIHLEDTVSSTKGVVYEEDVVQIKSEDGKGDDDNDYSKNDAIHRNQRAAVTPSVVIPHGGYSKTASAEFSEYDTSTDLSHVAHAVLQDFKSGLEEVMLQNRHELKLLLHNVTIEIHKLRQKQKEQILTNEQTMIPQAAIDDDDVFYSEESNITVSTNAAVVATENYDDSLSVAADDEELFVDATSVPYEDDKADTMLPNYDTIMPSTSTDSATERNTATTLTQYILGDNEDLLDFDDADLYKEYAAKSKKTLKSNRSSRKITTKKKARGKSAPSTFATTKKRRKKSVASKAITVADLDEEHGVKLVKSSNSKYMIAEVDDLDDGDDSDSLLSSSNYGVLLYRPLQRLLLSTITAVCMCFIYIIMKRFASIMMGLIVDTSSATETDMIRKSRSSSSSVIPKP